MHEAQDQVLENADVEQTDDVSVFMRNQDSDVPVNHDVSNAELPRVSGRN